MIHTLLSSILFSLSFPNPFFKFGFGVLAWVSLLPLFFGLQNVNRQRRIYNALIYGVVTYSLILEWLWPLHTIGTMLFVLVLSVQPVIFILFYRSTVDGVMPIYVSTKIRPNRMGKFLNDTVTSIELKKKSRIDLLFIPSLWVASEWVRTYCLNGFCFTLGYSQSFIPGMAQLASLGGSYAVSFVIVVVNYCLYLAWMHKDRRNIYLGLAVLMFMANWIYGLGSIATGVSKESNIISVAGIQPNINPEEKLDSKKYDQNIDRHIILTNQILVQKSIDGIIAPIEEFGSKINRPDLIVWPETAFVWDLLRDRLWFEKMKSLAKASKAVLILGAATLTNDRNLNSAVVLNSNGEINGVYHKNHLVPICEYYPENKVMTFIKDRLHWQGFDFAAGKKQEVFSFIKDHNKLIKFGVLICSESCYPQVARQLVNLGADFMIVILNDGWFSKPEAIMIHAQNAIMRAIESGRDVLSVGNTGWTFRVDYHGLIQSNDFLEIQKPQSGILNMVSRGRDQQSIYHKFGDFFSAGCLLFVIMTLFLDLRNQFRKQ